MEYVYLYLTIVLAVLTANGVWKFLMDNLAVSHALDRYHQQHNDGEPK